MNSLFSIRKKANKYTGEQVKKLIQDGKYIPGVFVELNNSKEVEKESHIGVCVTGKNYKI